MRAVGARQAIRDTIFGMSGEHLSVGATTVFEALEDAGLEPAAINFTCYRGRTRHPIKHPALARWNRWYEAVYGPKHFFYFNLFESERTGAPLAIRSRLEGSIDEYAAAVGRWLVTRDAFDFLVFYLPDYDYASHLAGPDAVARTRSSGRTARSPACWRPPAAPSPFSSATPSSSPPTTARPGWSGVGRLQDAFPPTPGRRARPCLQPSRHGLPAPRLSARRPHARRAARQLSRGQTWCSSAKTMRRSPGAMAPSCASPSRERTGAWRETPPCSTPSATRTGSSAPGTRLLAPTAGDVLVSATEGWELADGGGRHHAGGGSHGSLVAGDSYVPLIAAGFDGASVPARIRGSRISPRSC